MTFVDVAERSVGGGGSSGSGTVEGRPHRNINNGDIVSGTNVNANVNLDVITASPTAFKYSNVRVFEMDHFPKRPALDLAFEDITYTVTRWKRWKFQRQQILQGISGAFKAGELTAIMGPSGAGKTTLLNILAGYICRGSNGRVNVNGQDRRELGMEQFRTVSCYIQQEDIVRSRLTVMEAMMLATHLKLGCTISREEKKLKVEELLEMLGLAQNARTLSGKLSGGQKKRLSIALELISNPPILFLDEPTTGLDSCSTTSCISLLRELAVNQGRTVVCTVHQPSALLFEQFNQIYCLTGGRCLYQGQPSTITTFFMGHGLSCPPYHNPADFMIEVAIGEYGCDLESVMESAEKSGQLRAIATMKKDPNDKIGLDIFNGKDHNKNNKLGANIIRGYNSNLPQRAPVWVQAFYLYSRNLIALRRNVTQIALKFSAHLIIALIFGYLYKGVGLQAESILANYIYIYGTNLFLHYTAQMGVLLTFPLEYSSLTREHFNRWYSLLPYCFALLLVEIPFQMVCAMIYIVPSYFMTDQPMDLTRFALFVLFNMAITYTAQSTGFLAGATCPITIAVFIAPVISVFLSAFGFSNKYADMPVIFKPLYNISYFRSTFHGSFHSIYGLNRADLPCDDFYCHFRRPVKFLREMGFEQYDMLGNFFWIVSFGSILYAITVLSVWFKLNKR